VPEEYRSRRSCLAAPGSSQRFLDKARGLAADEVFLDLEDAVAPAAKEAARRNVIAALTAGGWGGKLVAVRVNGAATRWAYRDVAEVVAAAGRCTRARSTSSTGPSRPARTTTSEPSSSWTPTATTPPSDEMIDEASRKLALVVAAKGRAAGLRRSQRFEPAGEGSAEDAPRDEGLGQPAGQG
jgi:hypothetical protein